jgi:hypothetical protein
VSATTDDALVSIERLEGVYRVAADHPAPGAIRGTLDRLVRSRLEEACGRSLTPLLDPADPSIWLIREVEVELAVNAAVSTGDWSGEDALVAAWAAEIAERIAALIAAGPDGERVIRYRDRADLLARFLTDVAAGGNRDGWDWPEFAGLRLLPRGRAIREVLVREPEAGTGVLARLAAEGRLEPVLQAMTDSDADAVCEALLGAVWPVSLSPGLLVGAIERWETTGASRRAGPTEATERLRRLVTAYDIEHASPGFLMAVDRLGRLASLLANLAVPAAELLAALESRELPRALALLGGGDDDTADTLGWVARAVADDPSLLDRLSSVLSFGQSETRAKGRARSDVSTCTGVFLLLPSIRQLQLEGPGQQGTLLALIGVKCLPREIVDPMRDPGFQAAFDLESGLDIDGLLSLIPDELDEMSLQRALVRVAVERGWVEGGVLVADCARTHAGELLVLRDPRHDVWVFAGKGVRSLESGIELVERATGRAPHTVARTSDLADRLGIPVGNLSGEHARRAKALTAELGYFAMPEVPDSLDALLTPFAHAAMRHFARRLPGLAWSSAGHLAANVLMGDGRVRSSPDVVEAALGPRPLDVVIRMAGFYGASFSVPWLEREVRIGTVRP